MKSLLVHAVRGMCMLRFVGIVVAVLAVSGHVVGSENSNPKMCRKPDVDISTSGPDHICPDDTGSWTVSGTETKPGEWKIGASGGPIHFVDLRNVTWTITDPSGGVAKSGGGVTATYTAGDTPARGDYTVSWTGTVHIDPNILDCVDWQFNASRKFHIPVKAGHWEGGTDTQQMDFNGTSAVNFDYHNDDTECPEVFKFSYSPAAFGYDAHVDPVVGVVTLPPNGQQDFTLHVHHWTLQDIDPGFIGLAPAGMPA